jgi:MraZ protein
VLTTESFDLISQRVNQISMTDPAARLLRRLIFSNAAEVEFDRNGRILIQAYLRNGVNLNGSAIVVGVGDHFEIWAPELWQQQTALLEDGETNAKRFAALNLPIQ